MERMMDDRQIAMLITIAIALNDVIWTAQVAKDL